MSWRVLFVSKPSSLSLKNHNILLKQENSQIRLPLEDYHTIVLESKQIYLTTALLSKLAQKKIILLSCDDSHLPNGIFMPFLAHSRFSKVVTYQVKASKPFYNRLWQSIIKQKIINQAKVLKYANINEYKYLYTLADKVQSGDKKNIESYAASIYWDVLFDDFNRRELDIRNSALNYGYSIIRSAIARVLVSYGLLPNFGIFHSNELNAFNLVDDFIEPFRAFVDFEVYKIYTDANRYIDDFMLSKDDKVKLIMLLEKYINISGEKLTILNAIEKIVYSYQSSLKNKTPTIPLPTFLNEVIS